MEDRKDLFFSRLYSLWKCFWRRLFKQRVACS